MSTHTATMEMEQCPACGVDVRPQDTLCWNCGSALRTASPAPQPEQMPSGNSARLVVTTSAGEVLQEYLLTTAAVTIGRVAPATIVLFQDRLVSRRHASVRSEQGHYVLRDERSANGTAVNGVPLQELVPYLLQDGDQVEIGEHRLVFHAQQSSAGPR